MSTTEWTDPNTEIKYKIGNVGYELSRKGLSGVFANIFRATYPILPCSSPFLFASMAMDPKTVVPTYGLWAGPGWSAGIRTSGHEAINWTTLPCYNENVKTSSNPENCFSLVDVICKTHDWRYSQADLYDKNSSAYVNAIKRADILLLEDIAVACTTHSYQETEGIWDRKTYTGTFDGTEITYLTGLVPLFFGKIEILDNANEADIIEAKTALNIITSVIPIDGTILQDPADSSKKTIFIVKDGLMITQKESASGSDAWIMNLNAGASAKPINVTIAYGTGSTKAPNTFVCNGDGVIRINGGTGNDKITITGAKNEASATYKFEIAGGSGNDTYYLDNSFNYKLIDSGDNSIFIDDGNGGWIDVGNLFKKTGDTCWKSEDGSIVLTGSTITLANGKTIELNDNFQSGDFGINLITLPTNPGTGNTITGDLTPVDFDPNTPGIQEHYDQWGNVIVDPNQPDPGRADKIYDTFGNDLIVGGAGDDVINTVRGGDDWVKGGDGCDIIAFPTSFVGTRQVLTNSIIEGGAGSDIILGHYTVSNQLFGDSYGDMATLIAAGEVAPDSGQRGDFISDYYIYDAGQNQSAGYLYGSNGGDILINNVGKGLIVGGGGDDLIYGDFDGDVIASDGDNYRWSYTIDVSTDVNGGTLYTPVITGIDVTFNMAVGAGDDDVIYAGTGNDYVSADGGDDEVYGGTGNDTIFGGAGNDFIEGGDGNDTLVGDSGGTLPPELNGNDYIDGGDGNDLILANPLT